MRFLLAQHYAGPVDVPPSVIERAGRLSEAFTEFTAAAARTTNLPEQHYLTTQAARLQVGTAGPPRPL